MMRVPVTGWYANRMPEPAGMNRDAEQKFWRGVQSSERCFMGKSAVHGALVKLVQTLRRETYLERWQSVQDSPAE